MSTVTTSMRDALIARGMPVVRRIAYQRIRRMPFSVDLRDLIGAGHEGLLKAVQRYDPERDAEFTAYVAQCARGAMKDEARTDDMLTRYGRSQANRIARATHALRHEFEREPTDEEIAKRAVVTLEALHTGPALILESDFDEMAYPSDSANENAAPEANVLMREHIRILAAALGKLDRRKRYVLEQYYWHEQTQCDIGRALGVTESRVCQMLGKAVASLRTAFDRAGAPAIAVEVVKLPKHPKKAYARKHDYNHSQAFRLKQAQAADRM